MDVVNAHKQELGLLVVVRVLIPFAHDRVADGCLEGSRIHKVQHTFVAGVGLSELTHKLFVFLTAMALQTNQGLCASR